ncbi:MAG: mobile mystery protein A [Candidatus Pseudobacter hemicellulosilyticus]|uniref:Mobile mystery protein A n=1 Tax=Candidatus Pseudobacter hemicellulosilyticus TaxID=3121375 RepID=A0AAJ5WL62_9BACT|nr:MAG: mobile mystery protein A [Pseudobacter sp.]
MGYWDKKIVRQQLDDKLQKVKTLPGSLNQDTGWIKVIRESLGMSTRQLAQRVGIDQSRITRLENAEIDGDLKLSSLKKIAEGLNMRFVYAIVVEGSLEEMMLEQAKKIALKRMAQVNQTMKLEKQELSDEQKAKALEDLIQKILVEEPKDFWDQ